MRSTGITCPTIRALKALHEEEETTKEYPKSPAIDSKNLSKTLEVAQECFGIHLGTTNDPLSYVVREETDDPPHPTDSPYGQPNSAYSSP